MTFHGLQVSKIEREGREKKKTWRCRIYIIFQKSKKKEEMVFLRSRSREFPMDTG